jgi:hypothetical protein
MAPDFAELTQGNQPLKALTESKPSTGGRNHYGRVTSRFRGGGHKRRFRVIDFRRDKLGVPAKVASIEYDPNRSARIALLHYADGEKRYILWPVGLAVGDTVISSAKADIKPGNALPLRNIPLGTTIHNVELKVDARRWFAPPAVGPSSWPKKASGGRCVCPRARFAWFTLSAGPRSGSWAMSSTAAYTTARPVEPAGSVGVPTIAASP